MTRPVLSLELLNHASVLMRVGEVAVLTDPWYSGTCFRDSWGLQYENPEALDHASTATHLWISHFHEDHLHMPTLCALAARAPHLQVLGNVSATYDLCAPLRRAGFTHVETLPDRQQISLTPTVDIMRYPSSGLDNMLVLRMDGWTILNLNDCNMPTAAFRQLARQIGPVDILLTNFNHAHKLLERQSDRAVRRDLLATYDAHVNAFQPRWVVPFASMHYYRAAPSIQQNTSLLTTTEIAMHDTRAVPIAVGDCVRWDGEQAPVFEHVALHTARTAWQQKSPSPSVEWEMLYHAAEQFRQRLRDELRSMARLVPAMRVYITDWHRALECHLIRGVQPCAVKKADTHVAAHSAALHDWFQHPYGTDAFFVGADFEVVSRDAEPIHRMLLAGLLLENRCAPRQVMRLLRQPSGWRFLWDRREELWALTRTWRWYVGNRAR